MIVDHQSPEYLDFRDAFDDYYGSLSPSILSGGFADSKPAPPAFNGGAEQTWANNYSAWFGSLNATNLANGMYSGGGGKLPPDG